MTDQKSEDVTNACGSLSGNGNENSSNAIASTTAKKPSGFAAVISSSANQAKNEEGSNSTSQDAQQNASNQSAPSPPVSSTAATPLEGQGALQIDSRDNSPSDANASPSTTSKTALTTSKSSASTVATNVAITPAADNQSDRPPPSAPPITNTATDHRLPQPAHMRQRSGTSQFPTQNQSSALPAALPPTVHRPATVHMNAPNPAGVVLPFSTAANLPNQPYGLVAAPAGFGHNGGQTLIINQYGQPVGVVSPSPAAGQQALALSSNSGAPPAHMQINSVSSSGAVPPPAQPLIMAYRQPGNNQPPPISTPHSQTNSPATNVSSAANINLAAAAAAAAAAASMPGIPLFPSHFNPFQCNFPVLVPTASGQVLCRTPQGHVIGFQVPAMASHHPIAIHQPQPTLDQQQHLVAAASSKYPHVLPKLAPSTGGVSGFNSQASGNGPQIGLFGAVGSFPMMASGSAPLLSQQPSVVSKTTPKTVPVLPMVPVGSGTSTPTNTAINESSVGHERNTPIHLDQSRKSATGENAARGHLESMSTTVAMVSKGVTDLKAATKRRKPTPSGPDGKTKRKKSNGSMDLGVRGDRPFGGPMKNVSIIDDDPGPLRVYTAENSEQAAQEIHEMFVRALADQRGNVGPPQVLTHLIDGYIIQESTDPFPISPHPFDDFNISALVMTTDSLSEWSAPPQLSPACARSAGEASSDLPVCPHCGRAIEGAPYSKAPAYCSRFCFKAYQRMEEHSALSPGQKRQLSTSSLTQSSGASSVQSPVAISPKPSLSPPVTKDRSGDEKLESAPSVSSDTSGSLLRLASPKVPSHAEFVGNKKPSEWTVDDVFNWVKSFGPGLEQHAPTFRQQEIDGQALLLLEEDHLTRNMGMKFGPALKLLAALKNLRKYS